MSKIVQRKNTDQKDKQLDSKNKNLNFVKIIQDQSKEGQNTKMNQHLKKVIEKIQNFQQAQRLQWSIYIFKKCESLLNKNKLKQLQFTLRIFVVVCSKFRIQYDEKNIEAFLKHVYYQKYGDQVIIFFQKAGYSTMQFKVLQYQDPWHVKAFNFFSNLF